MKPMGSALMELLFKNEIIERVAFNHPSIANYYIALDCWVIT